MRIKLGEKSVDIITGQVHKTAQWERKEQRGKWELEWEEGI